jgi:hypothetical protein
MTRIDRLPIAKRGRVAQDLRLLFVPAIKLSYLSWQDPLNQLHAILVLVEHNMVELIHTFRLVMLFLGEPRCPMYLTGTCMFGHGAHSLAGLEHWRLHTMT